MKIDMTSLIVTKVMDLVLSHLGMFVWTATVATTPNTLVTL